MCSLVVNLSAAPLPSLLALSTTITSSSAVQASTTLGRYFSSSSLPFQLGMTMLAFRGGGKGRLAGSESLFSSAFSPALLAVGEGFDSCSGDMMQERAFRGRADRCTARPQPPGL